MLSASISLGVIDQMKMLFLQRGAVWSWGYPEGMIWVKVESLNCNSEEKGKGQLASEVNKLDFCDAAAEALDGLAIN